MEQKEYWELFLVQGKNKIWLKTYGHRDNCTPDVLKLSKIIKGEKHITLREIWKQDSSTFDFGSQTTFFEIKKVVKNEDS